MIAQASQPVPSPPSAAIAASRTRLGTDEAEKLGPLDALRRYLASKNTPADREQLLVERAEQLLRAEIEDTE